MIDMTGEMQELVDVAQADRVPCYLGTASKDGQPQISMKGSVMVFDAENLAYWERAKRSALENVGQNPHVVIFYNNPDKRIRWRFHGKATIYDEGPIREEVMGRTIQAELDRDPERLGVAVVVKVEKITDLGGNALQQLD